MKKGTLKYIVGGSMVGFGILLIFIAVCIGGWGILRDFGGINIDWDGVHYYVNDSNEFDLSGGNGTMDKKDIKNLKIDVEYGSLIIKTGNVDEIKVSTKNIISNRFSMNQENDTAIIKYKGGFSFFTWKSDSEIIITLPDDMTFDKTVISNGAGTTEIKDFISDELKMSNGAGEFEIENLTVKKKLILENGAGAVNMNNVNCGEIDFNAGVGEIIAENVICEGLKMDGGVGSFKFSGEINGDVDIDNGIGEVRMTVYGNTSDYRFDVDSGVGNVRVNGQTPIHSSEGKYKFKIDTGIGEVTVNFKDKEK
ncbi:MAG: DUF4097 domain-containing protein [Ruminococcaceae bacterium]|nr:DUF4097 domain-containing protein [Oscillospiraceae bacterium]